MEFKSKNPFLSGKSFKSGATALASDYQTMTVSGTISKTYTLFILLVAGAFVPYYMEAHDMNYFPAAIVSLIVGVVMVIIASVSPKTSPYTAPAYALFEGVFIGALSMILNNKYPGIALQAVVASLTTFGICLGLYRFRIVKVTEQFKSVVIASTMAIGTYYLVSIVLSMFGISLFHHGNSLMSIGFSVFVIIIAALNLIMDFDLIEQGARRQLPKYMEWYSGMGLVITMVWLYIEFLRLLSKIQSRN